MPLSEKQDGRHGHFFENIYIFLLAFSTRATFTKFAGCLYWGVSFFVTEICLNLKNKMAAADISLKIIYIFMLALSTPATFIKFAGCLQWEIGFSETEFSLILKYKMATADVSYIIKFFYWLFLIGRRMNLFIGDMYNRYTCPLQPCRHLTLKLLIQGHSRSSKVRHVADFKTAYISLIIGHKK